MLSNCCTLDESYLAESSWERYCPETVLRNGRNKFIFLPNELVHLLLESIKFVPFFVLGYPFLHWVYSWDRIFVHVRLHDHSIFFRYGPPLLPFSWLTQYGLYRQRRNTSWTYSFQHCPHGEHQLFYLVWYREDLILFDKNFVCFASSVVSMCFIPQGQEKWTVWCSDVLNLCSDAGGTRLLKHGLSSFGTWSNIPNGVSFGLFSWRIGGLILLAQILSV